MTERSIGELLKSFSVQHLLKKNLSRHPHLHATAAREYSDCSHRYA